MLDNLNPAFDPALSPDAQEAESVKYGNGCLIIYPLKSGNFAIFDRTFKLRQIVSELPNWDGLNQLSFVFKTELTSRAAEARFYGEPSDRQFAADIKQSFKPKTPNKKPLVFNLNL